jgi:hypothetical protein
MFRACCEHVACNIQHQESFSLHPHVATILLLYCDHVVNVLHATSNIRSSPPRPPQHNTKPNITCLQHRNSTSATLKFNVCNIQQHVSEHQDSTFATSKINVPTTKIFRSNFETFTWKTRNMPRTQMQHGRSDCNMNEKRLDLMQTSIYKPMQHRYATNTTSVNDNCDIKK